MVHQSLKDFHPLVARWFTETYGEPTPPQAEGWPRISAGKNVLLLAPTGSGKTLSAFLKALDWLYKETNDEEVIKGQAEGVKILYVSPLRALNNDIYRNLDLPLKGIKELSERLGRKLPEISKAVRSGDTPAAERQRMLRRPPQILITTPESLFLMLSSKARNMFKTVRYVIIDEIHTLFPRKRGAHLALSLERLQSLVEEFVGDGKNPIQRIGLSATMKPLEEIAAFLGGYERTIVTGNMRVRPVEIVDTGLRKELDLQITLPVLNLRELPDKSIWPSIYQKVTALVFQHRTTLVFVNNRRLAERLTANINKLAGKEIARTHHGSLAREVRLDVEEKLKNGEIPCLVATSSLELGIDIGEIDLVIQIESPKEVARGLQRVGRAGHVIDMPSKGRILPKNRADLLETVVLMREMLAGRVEKAKAPMNCLDILAQQLVAVTATGEEKVEKVYNMVRSVYNYHSLSRLDFERVLTMMNGSYDGEFWDLRPRLFWDRGEGVIRPDAYGRRLVYTAGGTIPDRGYFSVYLAGSNLRLGELDEEFVYERRINERFLLGTSVWRIEEIKQDRVIVSAGGKGEAYVPFWKAEQEGRPYELGKRFGAFLALLEDKLETEEYLDLLREECGINQKAAKNLQRYLLSQKKSVDFLPTDKRIVVEEFPDEAGEWRVLIHSTLGGKIHMALGLLIRDLWEERFKNQFQAIAGDDGIMFSVPSGITPPAVDWGALNLEEIEERLSRLISGTALFGSVFRHCAQRSLVMPRGGFGRKRQPLWLARIRAGNLLQTVAKYKDFPLVIEAYREIFQDYFDLDALREVLRDIKDGKIEVYRKNHQFPSPFAHGHLFNFVANFMYDNDTPKGGERFQLFGLGKKTLKTIVGDRGFRDLFDLEVIKKVNQKARGMDLLTKAINPERVRYWLEKCGDLTEQEIGGAFPEQRDEVRKVFSDLQAKGRVITVNSRSSKKQCNRFIINRDELGVYLSALEDAGVCPHACATEKTDPDDLQLIEINHIKPWPVSEAKKRLIHRYVRTHAPFTTVELASRYGFSLQEVEEELSVMASSGLVEAGEFLPTGTGEEWCDTELVKEIHRRSLVKARRKIEARVRVRKPTDYAVFIAGWQGVAGPRQVAEGLVETLNQMDGLWLPAAMWESGVLPSRIKNYNPLLLDRLIASGQFLWRARGEGDHFQVMFEANQLMEEELIWANAVTAETKGSPPEEEAKTHEVVYEYDLTAAAGKVWELLRRQGAITLPVILKETEFPTFTAWQALEELFLKNLVTNDSFGPIRYLLRTRPQDRSGAKGVLQPTVLAQMGRWSLLPESTVKKERLAKTLLNRYGIVCREIVRKEGYSWGTIYSIFDTLESIGQVKRGYFVEGLSGIQYALPHALDKLTASSAHQPQKYWALMWNDPANPLLYIARTRSEWPEMPRGKRLPTDYILFEEGKPIAAASGRKLKIQSFGRVSVESLAKGLKTLISALYPVYPDEKIIVSCFNGQAVTETPVMEVLSKIGFEEGYQVMTLWPSAR